MTNLNNAQGLDTKHFKMSIVIPAYNEAKTISALIKQIPRNIVGVNVVDVVVVDDGSTDDTADCAKNAGAEVIKHERNKGVGAAISTGFGIALARGADIVVNIDGDGQFNPEDIKKLVQPIIEGRADFVTASRFSSKEFIPQMPWIKKVGNKIMAKIVNICTGNNLKDVSCGFRAYSKDTLLKINLFADFTYTHETIISIANKGVRIVEIPLEVRGVREFGKSRVANNLFKYGLQTLQIIIRTLRDIRPLLFFGCIGLIIFLIGILLGGFVFIHWLLTEHTSPYQSLLIGSAVGILMGFLLIILALIADMQGRQRLILEQILYILKKDKL